MRKKSGRIMFIGLCGITVISLFITPELIEVDAQVIVTEEWVARFKIIEESIYPQIVGDIDIAIDTVGNIYVTGASSGNGTGPDYITIAYDTNGNERWIARYNGPGNWDDKPTDITLDSKGNVYVTGVSYSRFCKYDYTTIAYDSKGNELWVARYNGPGGIDTAIAITTDQLGNVYVTGYSWDRKTNHDYTTVAYDSLGNELWVARYNGPGNDGDFAKAIATDSLGNIYVTGWSTGIGTAFDYTTVAYDTSGNELWVARYDGPVNGSDYAYSIVLDLSGNIYVTGHSLKGFHAGHGTDYDCATIAYDRNGNELWVARYDGSQNGHDYAIDITTDLSGNIYVVGHGGENTSDYVTVAYDSSGRTRWVARYDGPSNGHEYAGSIVTDSLGNIYVAGYSQANGTGLNWTRNDYAIVAYDSSGRELWVARYNGPGNSNDAVYDLAVDLSGNVYVTGKSFGNNGTYDIATIKYSQDIITNALEVEVNIDPNTLNLKSKGKWITAYITLPKDYDVNDIDIGTISLENTVPAEWGDVQGTTLMVKFERGEVEDLIGAPGEDIKLLLTGEFKDGTRFEGSDTIRVIEPHKI